MHDVYLRDFREQLSLGLLHQEGPRIYTHNTWLCEETAARKLAELQKDNHRTPVVCRRPTKMNKERNMKIRAEHIMIIIASIPYIYGMAKMIYRTQALWEG